jgi:hypothetical protein
MGTTMDSITEGIGQAYKNTIAFLPKLAAFVLIVLVGYLAAKLISRLVARGLNRSGFDKLVERGAVKTAVERSGHKISDILGTILYYTIFLFVFFLAFNIFGPNQISDLLRSALEYVPNIFVAITILIIAAMVASGTREILEASMGGLSYGRFVANATSAAIVVLAVFAALSQLKIAERIIDGLFYTVLAIIGGSAIVAIGGGGIAPMRARWEKVLAHLDAEPLRATSPAQAPEPDAATGAPE